MAVEGRITGWLQLAESSSLTNGNAVNDFLVKLREDDSDLEREQLVWDHGFTAPFPCTFTYWDGWPPDFATELAGLCQHLERGEYVVFQYMTRCQYYNDPMQVLMVTHKGVRKAAVRDMISGLKPRAQKVEEGVVGDIDI